MEVVLEQIERMKPLNPQLSEKRFRQLKQDLEQGFTVRQLRNYAENEKPKDQQLPRKMVKGKMVDYILRQLWLVEPSTSVNADDDLIVENTLPLSKRDLFFVLADSGRLPRSWTETGASIAILSDELKIVVRSTQANFEWIRVSLMRYLESVQSTYVDVKTLNSLRPIEELPLARIQRFTNTYIETFSHDTGVVIFSTTDEAIDLAKRALVHATGFAPSVSSARFKADAQDVRRYPIMDDDAMPWNQRSLAWFREKQVSRRNTTGAETDVLPSEESAADSVTAELMEKVGAASLVPAERVTFTASFGYDISTDVSDAPTSEQQAFLTNVPHVLSKATGLPLYDDMLHETTPPEASSEPQKAWDEVMQASGGSVSADSATDAWNSVLYSSTDGAAAPPTPVLSEEDQAQQSWESLVAVSKQHTEKTTDNYQYKDYTYMAQLQFVPSPYQQISGAELRELPAVEMWFNVEDRSCDKNTVQIAAAAREHNAYLSLPSAPVDVKYQGTLVQTIDSAQAGVKKFLKAAKLGFGRNGRIDVPPTLVLEIGGKQVEYVYQSAQYRRSVELDFRGHLLQLSIVEGGEFAGRRVEASLVLDFADGPDSVDGDAISKFTRDAVAFAKSLS